MGTKAIDFAELALNIAAAFHPGVAAARAAADFLAAVDTLEPDELLREFSKNTRATLKSFETGTIKNKMQTVIDAIEQYQKSVKSHPADLVDNFRELSRTDIPLNEIRNRVFRPSSPLTALDTAGLVDAYLMLRLTVTAEMLTYPWNIVRPDPGWRADFAARERYAAWRHLSDAVGDASLQWANAQMIRNNAPAFRQQFIHTLQRGILERQQADTDHLLRAAVRSVKYAPLPPTEVGRGHVSRIPDYPVNVQPQPVLFVGTALTFESMVTAHLTPLGNSLARMSLTWNGLDTVTGQASGLLGASTVKAQARGALVDTDFRLPQNTVQMTINAKTLGDGSPIVGYLTLEGMKKKGPLGGGVYDNYAAVAINLPVAFFPPLPEHPSEFDEYDEVSIMGSKGDAYVYLRIDGRDGYSLINCVRTLRGSSWPSNVGAYEKLRLIHIKDDVFAVESTEFPGVFLRMDTGGKVQVNRNGWGAVNCQIGQTEATWVRLKTIRKGQAAIESYATPGAYLRLDPGGLAAGAIGGVVNCGNQIGDLETLNISPLTRHATREWATNPRDPREPVDLRARDAADVDTDTGEPVEPE